MELIFNTMRLDLFCKERGLKPIKKHPLNDYFFDFLDSSTIASYNEDEKLIQELSNAGFDLNLDNYIRVRCPYMPFNHYIHKIEKWII